MNNIISNCLLCEERSLHVYGEKDAQIMQCINCGYELVTKYLQNNLKQRFKKLSSKGNYYSKNDLKKLLQYRGYFKNSKKIMKLGNYVNFQI